MSLTRYIEEMYKEWNLSDQIDSITMKKTIIELNLKPFRYITDRQIKQLEERGFKVASILPNSLEGFQPSLTILLYYLPEIIL